jgi:uncharacterized ferritin-like protein (DUF455 family)
MPGSPPESRVTATRPPLDASLFADDPARDSRFDVKSRWIEMCNTAPDDPLHQVEFTHRQMNEEVNGLECSARGLTDFPGADWDIRMRLARQCADEVRHVLMFRRLLHRLGGHVGQFPVMNFQYRIITKADSLIGRLTIQNRTFEAGGLDAVSAVVEQMRARGDAELTLFFDSQLADEILHVRYANEYIRQQIHDDPRTVLRMGTAMTQAAKAFKQVMGSEGTEGVSYPIDRQARLEGGFTPEEVDMAVRAVTRSAEPGELVATHPPASG